MLVSDVQQRVPAVNDVEASFGKIGPSRVEGLKLNLEGRKCQNIKAVPGYYTARLSGWTLSERKLVSVQCTVGDLLFSEVGRGIYMFPQHEYLTLYKVHVLAVKVAFYAKKKNKIKNAGPGHFKPIA